MKAGIIIHDDDIINVFIFNDKRELRRKMWIQPNGKITYADYIGEGTSTEVKKLLEGLKE